MRDNFCSAARLLMISFGLLAACGDDSSGGATCTGDSYCNLESGGLCLTETDGSRACAYPDTTCTNDYKFSSGACVMTGLQRLTVQLSGAGSGNITSSPDGVVCSGSTCSGVFETGTPVTLTATATNGEFLGWGGSCAGQGTCSVTLTADDTEQAMFGLPGQALWSIDVASDTAAAARAVALDSTGNLIVVGTFTGTLQTSPPVVSNGGTDIFVAKVSSADGSIMWARGYGSDRAENVLSVSLDSYDNIYIGGSFQGVWTLGTTTLVPSSGDNNLDAFVARLGQDGSPDWGLAIKNPYDDAEVNAISAIDDGAIVAGDFGESSGVQLTAGALTVTNGGGRDAFALKVSPAGAPVWLVREGGTGDDDAYGVAVDSMGNAVVVGDYEGTVNFGGGNQTSVGMNDMFVVKLDGTTGAYVLDRHFGSADADSANAVTIDANDNMIIAGQFHDSVDFGSGVPLTAGPLNQYPSSDTGTMVVAKYSVAGANVWAKGFSGTDGVQTAAAVTANSAGDIALAGMFCGTINFGGSGLAAANECDLSGPGTTVPHDVFAARLSGTDGGYLNAVSAGGVADETTGSIAEDGAGDFFIAGKFSGFSAFGGNAFQSQPAGDGFVLALAPL
ncbi:MAG TPA: hypothetical protein VGM88_11630 [Kofleriaceae bacterium]|jgi:hypothetical protein